MKIGLIQAQGFPVCEYVHDECEARGWSFDVFCGNIEAMYDDPAVGHIVAHFLWHTGDPWLRLGEDEASALAAVMGTSKELWLNLDASYWRWFEAQKN